MKRDNYSAILGNTIGNPDMKELTKHRPLATLPFDGKYRLLDFQLSALSNAGIRNVFGIFQEKNMRSVFDHVRSGREWGLNTQLSHWFLGFYDSDLASHTTNDDYYEQVLTYLRRSGSNRTVYMGCDVLCNIDVAHVIALAEESDCDVAVVYKKLVVTDISQENDVLEVSSDDTVLSHGTLEEMRDKLLAHDDCDNYKMSADIYVVRTSELIARMEEERKKPQPRKLRYLLRDLLTSVSSLAYEYTGYVSNIHSVKSYYDANMDMLNPNGFYSLLYSNQKVYTKVKNEESTYFATTSHVKDSQFASGSIIKGTVVRSIISRNCMIDEHSSVDSSIVFPKVTIGQGARVQYAILDKNVTVAPGVTIRGTADEPIVVAKGEQITEDVTR
ncbi:glucose-1-phosphate adenylyltransferase subunit GlgD [Alloscardovia venturai]|uniref:Glucose-1-phosphate adenylyltransferase subunit GlgD n=1 Tax=Alloscardovia venturai TaxID=1769421 RepID=A0ABW2Y469_9BIFI